MLPSCAILDTIQVMRRKEVEYNIPSASIITDVDDIRSKMVDWCCRVISYCRLDIEIVYIAMNYTDRVCMVQPQLLQQPFQYQLVAMTSLYISAKVHAPEALDPKLVSTLSRGTYSEQAIEEQESVILNALQWKVNPITPHSMIRQFFELIGSTNESILSLEEQDVALQYALQQVNAYIVKHNCDNRIPCSTIAYCTFMNSLQYLSCITYSNKYMAFNLGVNLAQLLHINLVAEDTQLVKIQAMLDALDETGRKVSAPIKVNDQEKVVPLTASPTRVSNKCVYDEPIKMLHPTKDAQRSQQRRYSPIHILER